MSNNDKDFREMFIPKNSVQDSNWISRTQALDIDNGYNLTVKLDISNFMGNLRMITRMYYFIMLFGCLLAVVISSIVTRVLSKPLKELQSLLSAWRVWILVRSIQVTERTR